MTVADLICALQAIKNQNALVSLELHLEDTEVQQLADSVYAGPVHELWPEDEAQLFSAPDCTGVVLVCGSHHG